MAESLSESNLFSSPTSGGYSIEESNIKRKSKRWQSDLCIQGSRYLLGERFIACFDLKLASQRGQGEKREGLQISEQSSQNLLPKKYLDPCIFHCQVARFYVLISPLHLLVNPRLNSRLHQGRADVGKVTRGERIILFFILSSLMATD